MLRSKRVTEGLKLMGVLTPPPPPPPTQFQAFLLVHELFMQRAGHIDPWTHSVYHRIAKLKICETKHWHSSDQKFHTFFFLLLIWVNLIRSIDRRVKLCFRALEIFIFNMMRFHCHHRLSWYLKVTLILISLRKKKMQLCKWINRFVTYLLK